MNRNNTGKLGFVIPEGKIFEVMFEKGFISIKYLRHLMDKWKFPGVLVMLVDLIVLLFMGISTFAYIMRIIVEMTNEVPQFVARNSELYPQIWLSSLIMIFFVGLIMLVPLLKSLFKIFPWMYSFYVFLIADGTIIGLISVVIYLSFHLSAPINYLLAIVGSTLVVIAGRAALSLFFAKHPRVLVIND